jgi:hypothetical protein
LEALTWIALQRQISILKETPDICKLDLQYVIVATSELIVSRAGPAIPVGSLATAWEPVSIMKMNTLLNPPSFFSCSTILVAPGHSSIALSQRAWKSKWIYRDFRSSSSRFNHLPLVYEYGSSPANQMSIPRSTDNTKWHNLRGICSVVYPLGTGILADGLGSML